MTERPIGDAQQSAGETPNPITIERLSQMSQEEVDELPYGFIVLDQEGVVLLYNRYEQQMSRIPLERVIGRNFFREIAPCTRVEAFYGRFLALFNEPPGATARFSFRFHFLHGAQDVSIQFALTPGDRVLMTVYRQALVEAAKERPFALRHESHRGRLDGPQGVIFTIPWDQTTSLFARVGSRSAREVGRAMGHAVARAAERTAVEAGSAALTGSPDQLIIGALDEAIAQLGLGRFAADLLARPRCVACFVRPPTETTSVEMSVFYEGMIETALSLALGVPHAVRCIEGTDLESFPWRFLVVPREQADELLPREGERPDDIARRFDLLDTDNGRSEPPESSAT